MCILAVSSLEAKSDTKLLKQMNISANYIQASIGDIDSAGHSIPYGFEFDIKEKYVAGVTFGFIGIDDSETDLSTIALMAGYKPLKNTIAYTEITYDFNDDHISGVGYSLGAKYQVFDYVALNAKYHMATLSPLTGKDIDFSYAAIGLELNFKTSE